MRGSAPTRRRRNEFWRGGRVDECAGLEIRCTVIPYRRFESDPLRQDTSKYGPSWPVLLFACPGVVTPGGRCRFAVPAFVVLMRDLQLRHIDRSKHGHLG